MNKRDLERRLTEENLMFVFDGNVLKHYVDGTKVYINGEWDNMTNVYGIYAGDEGEFVIFMTDDERGLPYYIDVFDSESEACLALYEMAVRLKYIHDKGL